LLLHISAVSEVGLGHGQRIFLVLLVYGGARHGEQRALCSPAALGIEPDSSSLLPSPPHEPLARLIPRDGRSPSGVTPADRKIRAASAPHPARRNNDLRPSPPSGRNTHRQLLDLPELDPYDLRPWSQGQRKAGCPDQFFRWPTRP
jgi:hypothetical protein